MEDESWITTLWLGATRYYLGRMNFAVSDFCEGLRREWDSLPSTTQALIRRDIEEAFAKHLFVVEKSGSELALRNSPLGMPSDAQQWQKVRELWAAPAEGKI